MKKYKAFTLLELTIVMVIFVILAMISVVSYRSLVDSFSINEVSLTIAQDIRGAQRSAMMLERDANERWLHGIGLDFGRIETEGEYDIFKWCSEFDYYDESERSLTNVVPNLKLNELVENSRISLETARTCLTKDRDDGGNVRLITDTRRVSDYDNLTFNLMSSVRYILFESISGKAFFYDGAGNLLNYVTDGPGDAVERILDGSMQGEPVGLFENLVIELNSSQLLERFELEIEPMRKIDLSSRNILVQPVSGMINFEFNKEFLSVEEPDEPDQPDEPDEPDQPGGPPDRPGGPPDRPGGPPDRPGGPRR